jgi:hypothetical protein
MRSEEALITLCQSEPDRQLSLVTALTYNSRSIGRSGFVSVFPDLGKNNIFLGLFLDLYVENGEFLASSLFST